jgi:hypothetical protein
MSSFLPPPPPPVPIRIICFNFLINFIIFEVISTVKVCFMVALVTTPYSHVGDDQRTGRNNCLQWAPWPLNVTRIYRFPPWRSKFKRPRTRGPTEPATPSFRTDYHLRATSLASAAKQQRCKRVRQEPRPQTSPPPLCT